MEVFGNLSCKIKKYTEHRKITEEEFKRQKSSSGYSEYRTISKHLNFLMLFGGGAKMFAEHALEVYWSKDQVEDYIKTIDPAIMEDVNTKYSKESELKRKYIAVATVMRNNFFNAYPELATRIEREEAFARRKGYCTSAFGSTRNFIELKECGTYDNKYNSRIMDNLCKISSNYRAQNYEACITKRVMYEMQNWLEGNGYKSRLFNEIHDSMDLYIYKPELNDVLSHLQHLCERKVPELKDTWVPLIIDCEIADLADKNHDDTYKHGRSPIEFGIKDWSNFKYMDIDPFNVELYKDAELEYFDERKEYWTKTLHKRDPLSSKIKDYLTQKYNL